MKAVELKDKSIEELVKLADEQRSELARLRFQHSSGQLSKTADLKHVRKNIARILTVLELRKRKNNAGKSA